MSAASAPASIARAIWPIMPQPKISMRLGWLLWNGEVEIVGNQRLDRPTVFRDVGVVSVTRDTDNICCYGLSLTKQA